MLSRAKGRTRNCIICKLTRIDCRSETKNKKPTTLGNSKFIPIREIEDVDSKTKSVDAQRCAQHTRGLQTYKVIYIYTGARQVQYKGYT